jgi:dienelactone hydrolase
MTRHLLPLYLLFAFASSPAAGQEPRLAFAPPAAGIMVATDVGYGSSGSTRLAMDVYTPPLAAGTKAPALVFFNRATGAERSGAFYAAWARAAASKGIIAILPDLRSGTEAADFRILLGYLEQHGADHRIDAVAVYAGSGNVSAAFPAVEDPALTSIKAAVIYYGTANVPQFRLDLPVLYVRAGLDRPSVNTTITALAAEAVAQNAPLTLLNHAGGHHAFEMVDDTDTTREVIDTTLAFVKNATSAPYQSALRASLPEAAAAGYVQTGKFHEAAAAFAAMVAARPGDPRLRLSYGEALLGDKQYGPACAEFDKLRGAGLGPRDLGVPAARACMLKGDGDAAIGWLQSIPERFRPASLAADPVFAPIKDRADFRALFPPRQGPVLRSLFTS